MTRHPYDLYACLAISILLIITRIEGTPQTARTVVGLLFLLIIPGYLTLLALFPERGSQGKGISLLDRTALSLGLSVALIPITGMVLTYSPWGFNTSTLIPTLLFIAAATGTIGTLRWARLPEQERYYPQPSLTINTQNQNQSRSIIIALIIVVILTLATTSLLNLLSPPPDQGFTELYLLDLENGTLQYPARLPVNSTESLMIGVNNFEGKEMTYYLEAWLVNQTQNNQDDPQYRWGELLDRASMTLPPNTGTDPQWETLYNLRLKEPGTYRVIFLLDIESTDHQTGTRITGEEVEDRIQTAYRRVHLWVEAS